MLSKKIQAVKTYLAELGFIWTMAVQERHLQADFQNVSACRATENELIVFRNLYRFTKSYSPHFSLYMF